MSFAVDLSPAGNMDSSSGISSQLFNLVLEVAIFVASEVFLRSFDTRRGSAEQNRLLLIQGIVLLVFSGALYFYNGIPYLLLLFSLIIMGRALFVKRPSSTYCDSHNGNNVVVSKPLGNTPKKLIMQENYVPNYCNESGIDNRKETGYQSLSVENSVRQRNGPQVISKPVRTTMGPMPLTTSLLPRQRIAWQDNSHVLQAIPPEKPLRTLFSLPKNSPSTSPPGLTNHGNTCFINSIIQCMVWVPKFSDIVVKLAQQQLQSEEESKFVNCLENIISQCQCLPDGEKVFNPVTTDYLLNSISALPSQYLVASAEEVQTQQDAAEFLQWLLNNLHSASNNSNSKEYSADERRVKELRDAIKSHEMEISNIGSNDLASLEGPMQKLSDSALQLHLLDHSSLIHEMFMGQFLEVRQCTTCERITTNSEYFTILPLPVISSNEPIHLRQCLQSFSTPESLAQDNMIACSCSQEGSTATRLSILSIIPNVLIIQLSRFTYDNINRYAMKNSFPVHFDTVFDIYDISLKKKFQPQTQGSLSYSLQAFCAHSGGHVTSSGHYVSFCKASDGQWYYYNDDNVTLVADIGQELQTEYVLRNAYILFYTKC